MSKAEGLRERRPGKATWLTLVLAALAVLACIGGVYTYQSLPPAIPVGGVGIAVIYSVDGDEDADAVNFLTGIKIAVDQVNADGGLLGHPLSVLARCRSDR